MIPGALDPTGRKDDNLVPKRRYVLMNEFAGSFSGHARVLTVLSLTDVPGHELQTVEIVGPQSSTDQNWNTARVTYWGVSDTVAGNGSQRGHFLNEHPDGSRNWGTFEGKVTTSDNKTTVEGMWQFSDGTGLFAGIKGQGTYTTRLISPTDVQCTWEGRYELAASTKAA
jgi:hypothetical protein